MLFNIIKNIRFQCCLCLKNSKNHTKLNLTFGNELERVPLSQNIVLNVIYLKMRQACVDNFLDR